jgi:hypothetical protein
LLHPSTESGTDATKAAIALHASTPELVIRAAGKNRFRADGASGNVWVGGNGAAGHLVLFGSAATQTNTTAQARVHLDGSSAKLSLMDGAGKNRVVLDGNQGNLFMFDGNGKDTLHLRASDGMLRVGGNGQEGDVLLLHANNSNSVHISAATGDIVLANADCAEDFDLIEEAEADPGSVMVLDERGGVRQSSQPYDRSVVGVVAGAGGYRPGIVLDRTASVRPRAPLSMVGKAFCKVDATIAPVATGDLLTSSPTPGHAMKASDPARSFGAVLGKALRPLAGGTGLIPIVVALQ